jgi:hypothetical protein
VNQVMLELCGVAQRHLAAAEGSVPSAVLGRCYFDMPAVAVVTEGAPSMVNVAFLLTRFSYTQKEITVTVVARP